MILDERLEFADNTLISQAGAGTTVLGDVIDTGAVSRDLGMGQDVYWYLQLDAAAAGGTSARFQLVSSAAANLGTPTVHLDTGVINLAQLTPAGKVLYFGQLPQEGLTYLRYLGVQQVVVGTFSGTGAVSSGLTLDAKGWRAYPDAVN